MMGIISNLGAIGIIARATCTLRRTEERQEVRLA